MKKIILSIEGMTCSACSSGLEKYLNKQNGIINASVNLVLAQALIEYEDSITLKDINRFIKEAGFKSLGEYNIKSETKKKSKVPLIVLSFLALFILYISMGHMINLPKIPFLDINKYPINYILVQIILVIPFLIYGFDILKNGYNNLFHRIPNMDTLVSIGVTASIIYSIYSSIMIILGHIEYTKGLYFESAAIVIYFIKVGRLIDINSKEKTKEAIKGLVQITPTKALLKVKNSEREVSIDEINKGDILIAKAGMKIAVDGIITNGSTHLDESFITGESVPIKKTINDKVIAGSINYDGYIEYKAEKIGKESMISEIVKLVIEATNTKAPISKIADRISNYFVPIIMIVAFLTLIIYLIIGYRIDVALTRFIATLVVACPCALGLATPLAIVVSEGKTAKKGILIKTSEVLENASKIDTVVFDKTGTLTYGDLKISKIYNYSNYSNNELIKIAASIESKSTHPISKAFINYMNENKIKTVEANNFKNISGLGLSAKLNDNIYHLGNNKIIERLKIKNNHEKDEINLSSKGCSIVYIIENDKIIGLIGVNDIIRNDAKSTIDKLKKLDKKIIMLTGDNDYTARIVAKQIGIDNIIANVMPKDKTDQIKKLIESGKKVMMIGDGINDAPSIATATIGLSMYSGTDIANNSADVILVNNKLENIIDLIYISKKTIKIIKQNLFWAFFYNLCMIPIAIGILSPLRISLNPMIAGLAMVLSSITVVLNTLRLK